MKKILVFSLVLVMMITVVSAGILDWFKEKQEITKPQIDSLITMNVSDKVFNIKKMDLDKGAICIMDKNDKTKVVKNKKCLKDKKNKYTLVDISDTDYFHSNAGGLIKFSNE